VGPIPHYLVRGGRNVRLLAKRNSRLGRSHFQLTKGRGGKRTGGRGAGSERAVDCERRWPLKKNGMWARGNSDTQMLGEMPVGLK